MYLVLEIQKMDDATESHLLTSYGDLLTAEQKYHTVLASAAVSNVPVHSAVILSDTGRTVKGPESYRHDGGEPE